MADESDERGAEGAPRRNSRNERLKLALRDNLKRRKSQARARNDPSRDKMPEASSNYHEDKLDDEAGDDEAGHDGGG